MLYCQSVSFITRDPPLNKQMLQGALSHSACPGSPALASGQLCGQVLRRVDWQPSTESSPASADAQDIHTGLDASATLSLPLHAQLKWSHCGSHAGSRSQMSCSRTGAPRSESAVLWTSARATWLSKSQALTHCPLDRATTSMFQNLPGVTRGPSNPLGLLPLKDIYFYYMTCHNIICNNRIHCV